MHKSLQELILPLVKEIINSQPDAWESLKYEINHGAAMYDFPYYLKAMEFQVSSKVAVLNYSKEHREDMVRVWKELATDDEIFRTDDEIIKEYGLILWEEIISQAEIAATPED